MNYKKENITSIGELMTTDGGRNLTPVFEGGNGFGIQVKISKEEFKVVRGNVDAMKDLAILKLNNQ